MEGLGIYISRNYVTGHARSGPQNRIAMIVLAVLFIVLFVWRLSYAINHTEE